MPDTQRFVIRIDPWFLPVLVLFGAFGERRTVTVDEDIVRVRFGFWDRRFQRSKVASVRRVRGNLLWGVGWHANFFSGLVVNGSLGGMVAIQFTEPQWYRLLSIPGRCTWLALSLEEPDALVAILLGAVSPLTP